MPAIRHKLVYSTLVFPKEELQSIIANSISKGLDTQVLPKFISVSDMTFNHSRNEAYVDFSINYEDIMRTEPSYDLDEDGSDEY